MLKNIKGKTYFPLEIWYYTIYFIYLKIYPSFFTNGGILHFITLFLLRLRYFKSFECNKKNLEKKIVKIYFTRSFM